MHHNLGRLLNSTILLAYVATIVCSTTLSAQNKTELDTEKQHLSKEIKTTEKLLKSVKSDKNTSLNELKLIQKQLENRTLIVGNIEQQLNIIEDAILLADEQIEQLNSEFERLKIQYAQMLRQSYLTGDDYDKLLYLFSAKDWNDAYLRYKYLQYYTKHSQKQVEQIQALKTLMEGNVIDLEAERITKTALLQEEEQERLLLEHLQTQQTSIIGQLLQRETTLRRALDIKRQAALALNDVVQAAIAVGNETEIGRTNSDTKQDIASRGGDLNRINQTSFAQLKGKLALPVTEGVITGQFGTHPHPVFKHIKTINNGVDITTLKNQEVHPLTRGKVSQQFFNPVFQWAVIVKHGEYFSVYANLAEVYVKKGETVATQDALGVVYTDTKTNKTELHLELWKGNKKLNPVFWLAR
ncbi:MAG: murein hydrolase activator EnvC family protein [Chitinophagales bacterium]